MSPADATRSYAPVLDPPNSVEVVGLVADFLLNEVYDAGLESNLRLRVRIAYNLLRIAERELQLADSASVDRDGFMVPKSVIQAHGSVADLTRKLRDGDEVIEDMRTFERLLEYSKLKMKAAAPDQL